MSPTLSNRLRHARRVLQKRRWLALLLRGSLAGSFLLLVPAALNRLQPIQEESTFLLLLVALTAFVAYLGWISFGVWRRPVPLPELAARVEEKHPQWMDALICATELEQKPEAKRRPLERALVTRMQHESAAVDFEAVLIPARWQNKALLAALALLVLLGCFLAVSSFLQKGGYYLADLITGEATGLRLEPGDSEAPIRTDVQVKANVLRWEDEPEIEYIDDTGRHRFPMHQNAEGHGFTFYDVADDIRYRIVTPSLRSPWYRVSPYIPPSINRTRIRVTPPAYTGLPEEELTELRDLTAVEGSEIEWSLTSPTAVSAVLQSESGDRSLEAAGEGTHELTLHLEESFAGRFMIVDEAGRSARTPPFQVKARPDLPPTIEVTQPGRDTEAEPDGEVGLAAIGADDFGLTQIDLHVSVSGQRKAPVRLFTNEKEQITERTVRITLDIPSLEAKEGDVVIYFFTAVDNRQPEPQRTRSEVFFIEVREEVVPQEMEGQPMELEQIDLQALILELKRLIRLSWEATSTRDPLQEREIAAGLEEVRLETAGVQQAIIDQAGEEAAAPVVALMNRAMVQMEAASQLIDEKLVDDSIPYQEMALADLVTIQTELMKNQTTSEEPSEGSSGHGPPPPETAQDDSLEELQRMMSEVQKLSDDQAAQNSAMRRMASGGLTPQQQAEFQQRQEAIQERTDGVNQELRNFPGTENAQLDLRGAASSMEDASAQIAGNWPEEAARDGDRARSSLLSALDSLEDATAAATGNQVAQLARQAQALAQQQGEAAGGSRGLAQSDSPSAEEGAALRAQQQAMQEQLKNLLSALDDTADQLRDTNPDASRAVAEAGQEVRDQNTAAEMGRAGNALLYRRFERAAEIQEGAAESLGAFAQALGESANLLPSMSREQLQQLLSQLQQGQQEVMEMTGKSADETDARLEQIASRMSQRLGRAGQALGDSTLREISGELGSSVEGDQSPNMFRTIDLLRAAARSLEQQIFALEIDRRARLQRQVSEPPERYRNLVEEYFKNLSETP